MRIHTLTVDGPGGLDTSVHHSETEAIRSLLAKHDPRGEHATAGDLGDQMQAVMDAQCLVVYIAEHEI